MSDTGLLPTLVDPFLSRSPMQHLYSVTHLMLCLLVPLPRTSNAIRLGTGTVWSLPFSLAAT